ncbi:penicillin-binding protein 2 [Desulfonatronovibrio magnus]|uniref:penicillin-binding protein 2 n=1 Tax=Desulfonatronovibrio magnus TaxID=698827 RepID=UPI0005EB9347|nr:penicillin-binding protein 2 [Desulfonatronovibrio magnus]RQD55520.1 MAG: penicillin-binding protein 2 [Desulfonatronovibrio sp. MSAO_Bac4]
MSQFKGSSFSYEKFGACLLLFLIFMLFSIFALRLWYLQVYKGEYFSQKARENVERRQHIYAPRGLISDRNGVLLAVNEPSYSLAIVREDCPDISATLNQISAWTGKELQEIEAEFQRGRSMVRSFENQILVPNLSFDMLTRVETGSPYWPGVKIVVQPRRRYLQGEVLSHVLGYVARANEAELQRDPELRLGDNVGKSGLELTMEHTLRGKKGLKRMEVDASGRVLHEEEIVAPVSGQDISLSIDLDLQQKAHSLMDGKSGSVVIIDADTGQIMALVSTPSYDNNEFVFGISHQNWQELLNNPHHPLQNRSIQSTYPPGSVFKLIMAGMAHMDPEVRTTDRVFCPGQMRLGNRIFRCWHSHGWVDMTKSLVESCDVYYYQLGDRFGVDRISSFSKGSGLGKRTGIDLPHERAGLIPTREWKRQRFNEGWRGGDNLNLSIGQGFTLVTPLQIARFTAALINGGYLYKPSLLLDEVRADPEKLPWSEGARDFVYRTMIETVDGDRGTARRLRTSGVVVGGKTGTAQVVRLLPEHKEDDPEAVEYWLRHHGWMAAFAHAEGRRYSITVLVEHGGSGSGAAGPVVRGLLDHIFKKDKAG